MSIVNISPSILHLNFIHSYLIKSKDIPISDIKVYPSKNKLFVKVHKVNYNLVNFPENCIPFFKTTHTSEGIEVHVLAIPIEYKTWSEKSV